MNDIKKSNRPTKHRNGSLFDAIKRLDREINETRRIIEDNYPADNKRAIVSNFDILIFNKKINLVSYIKEQAEILVYKINKSTSDTFTRNEAIARFLVSVLEVINQVSSYEYALRIVDS